MPPPGGVSRTFGPLKDALEIKRRRIGDRAPHVCARDRIIVIGLLQIDRLRRLPELPDNTGTMPVNT